MRSLPRRNATDENDGDVRATTPIDLRIEELFVHLVDALGARHRVLEVGCGTGALARRLGASGFEVTALDLAPSDPRPARGVTVVESDFLAFDAEPFDAIVFSSSLHHINPLERAIAHAARLLVPSGLLVVDDFDLDAPDADTLRWYYEVQELLAAAGLYPSERIDPPVGTHPGDDLVARWRGGHTHEPPLHTGSQMRLAISEWFAIRELRMTDFLHRYIGKGLPQDERGASIAAHLAATERKKIGEGSLTPVGLRVLADLA